MGMEYGSKKITSLNLPPLSLENEGRALQLLKQTCQVLLSKYPTSAKDDTELLFQHDLTYNQRNCIIFRLSEKKVSSASMS